MLLSLVEKLTVADQTAIADWLMEGAVKLVSALVILGAGLWLSQRLRKVIVKLLHKSNLEPTFVKFIGNFSYYLFLVLVGLVVLSQLGVATTSLIALLGTASLAVGLALQGSLANLAAGILLVLFRYFKVGDVIEVAGVTGTVEAIDIMATTLCTMDNCLVIIPNKQVIDNNITNYVAKPTRRLDLIIGVAYDADLDLVRRTLQEALRHHPEVLPEPVPAIAVGELAESSINLYIRPWVNSRDYIRLKLELTELLKRRLDDANITIPFPQRHLHLSGPWPPIPNP